MILNAYAVLDIFVSLLRLLLALGVVGLGVQALSRTPTSLAAEDRPAAEDRTYLLFSMAWLLLGLNVLSWPLLYLLLQSCVPEWGGQVMCIYGVTQVGKGSLGSSRFLPDLLQGLQVSKPALVFLSGAWFVLYRINRQTQTGPLVRRVLAVLVCFGLVAVADAAAETAYLLIPKKEESLANGCCTAAFDAAGGSSRFLPRDLSPEQARPLVYAAYYGIHAALLLALFASLRLPHLRMQPAWLALLLLTAALAVPISWVFLIDLAAPTLLHLPYHHCPYDLVPRAPEAVLAVALFLVGTFAVGWACVARWFGSGADSQPFLAQTVGRILRLGLLGYLGSLIMMSLEIVLA
jgi:hypothetical protein